VLPAGHRVAGKDTITIADLADEHLLQDPGAVPEWRDIATEMRTRRCSAPVFRTVEEKLEHVAAGHGIVFLPLSTAVFYTRPDVTYSHISDIPPNQVCLAWDATRRSRLIQDFAAIAADHLPVASRAEPDLVSPSEPVRSGRAGLEFTHRGMAVGSNDDGAVGGELLVAGQDSKSFECDVEVGLGGPACGRVLRQGADQGERLSGRNVATGPALALGQIP
jgi:LysR substrate binding domain